MKEGERRVRKIEFVSYNGKYPNLCSGWLELLIDGKPWRKYVNLFSGGQCYIDGEREIVEQGPWGLSKYEYDDLAKAGFNDAEIEKIVCLLNEHVEFGCCGGCL